MMVELDGPSTGFVARRLLQISAMKHTLIDDIDGVLVVLCSAARAPDVRQALSTWVRGEAGADHRGVLSRPMASPAELPSLYAMLKRSMAVLRRLGVQRQLIDQNELALYSSLFETHDAASLGQFLEASIGPLLDHDRARHAELAPTLLCFFDCNQNAKTTAQRLEIHVNTVRQRLATVERLIGHWGQASRALEVHIALRLWSLRH
jgi:DNA-binding PucR family transcriptional regulator